MMLVAIDYGKRTGVAKADFELKIPVPVGIFTSFTELVKCIKELEPKILVVGWPLLPSGKEGLQCHRVKSMLGSLLKELGSVKYFLQDERYSSIDEPNDAASAIWILQSFLNENNQNLSF